jgi:hypothetical protein
VVAALRRVTTSAFAEALAVGSALPGDPMA